MELDLEDLRQHVNTTDFVDILDGMKELLIRKNKDYNGASFRTGLVGNYCRLVDKFDRLENLMKNSKEPNFESIEDTYKDIIGYCTIALTMIKIKERLKKC